MARTYEVMIPVVVTVQAETEAEAKAFALDGLDGISHEYTELPGYFNASGWDDDAVTVTDVGPTDESYAEYLPYAPKTKLEADREIGETEPEYA